VIAITQEVQQKNGVTEKAHLFAARVHARRAANG
jgi:hypothetical protein